MLGMGLLSALYAVWDIALDGIKYAEVTEPDATLMAEVYNHTIQEHNRRQAIKSREFLPAQFHYGPADLRDDTKNASDAVSDTVSGWIDNK
uniref:Uncharacterized protein n=1 Tax=Cryptococcus bacillisporus CA1280 TaxID=1296109 RepID=A0A0D0VP88_CRYGA|nr:hypothetical protein I312_02691 [Cryptococcus bacillisporus CA1280]